MSSGWDSTIQITTGEPLALFDGILDTMKEALYSESLGDKDGMLDALLEAAGYIVGWRKELPEQGEDRPDFKRQSDRKLLRKALINTVHADEQPDWPLLRNAEACLRTIWNRHNDEGDR